MSFRNRQFQPMAIPVLILVTMGLNILLIFNACNDSDENRNISANADQGVTIDSAANVHASMDDEVTGRKSSISASVKPVNADEVIKDKKGIYNRVDVMPEFPGGKDQLASYVKDHIEYPAAAAKAGVEGTVAVSLVIDERGRVSETGVESDELGYGLEKEALRAIRNMPHWKAGEVDGKKVKTRVVIPVTYSLS